MSGIWLTGKDRVMIPLSRRIARESARNGKYYLIRLPRIMNDIWEQLYDRKVSVRVYIEIPVNEVKE